MTAGIYGPLHSLPIYLGQLLLSVVWKGGTPASSRRWANTTNTSLLLLLQLAAAHPIRDGSLCFFFNLVKRLKTCKIKGLISGEAARNTGPGGSRRSPEYLGPDHLFS